MADPEDRRTDGAPPTQVHVGPERSKGFSWLAWLLLILGVLALLYALSQCGRNDSAVVDGTNTAATDPNNMTAMGADGTGAAGMGAAGMAGAGTGAAAGTSQPLADTAEVDEYLAGTEATPRTFEFSRVSFRTESSELDPSSAPALTELADAMRRYPNSRIRIEGYADARGTEPYNMELGQQRAESIKTAIVAEGIDGGRIETVSGGENYPVAPNSTAAGQAQNRRSELIVLAR